MVIIFICMLLVSALGAVNPLLQREVFDNGIMIGDFAVVLRYTSFIIGIYLIEQILSFIQFVHFEYINRQIPYQLMQRAIDHSLDLKVSYHKDHNFSKTINNLNSDVMTISQIANANLLQAIVSTLKIIGGSIGLAIIDWRLMIFVYAIIPLELIIRRVIAGKLQKQMKVLMKFNEKFSIWFSETFMVVEVIKLWNLQKKRKLEFDGYYQDLMKTEAKMAYINQSAILSSQTLSKLFVHGLNLLGAIFILRNELTIGGLFAFTSYSMFVMEPIALIGDISYQLTSSIPAFERFMTYFENETEILEGVEISKAVDHVKCISFTEVVFGYEGKDAILKGVDFSIYQGERVAFVGVNGSGKSSMMSLLLRFFEPLEGMIKLNDIDIQDIALTDYRDLFTVMSQHVHLFDSTIKRNVNILGNLSEEEIQDCLRISTATEFIDGLPDGLDTEIGFNGMKLSGGERQKISLARALAKKGKVLILDEATASFDSKAEQVFNQYITQEGLYDMLVVISHREDILKRMDKIFIVDKGVIADVGTFDELLEKNGDFYKILMSEKEMS